MRWQRLKTLPDVGFIRNLAFIKNASYLLRQNEMRPNCPCWKKFPRSLA
ncbi:MAG: hypothetical protein ACI85I_000023 [Arenicella sp.]